MSRAVLGSVCAMVLVAGIAFASGGQKKTGQATAPTTKAAAPSQMQMMKAEMMKCDVCKHMATHIEELGPVMKMEVAMLNDGIAVMHRVTDPAKLPLFRTASTQMDKAGDACLTMTDEQAKTSLCTYCQDIRSTVKAGATMSQGDTTDGDIMVLTSQDPAVQKRLEALGAKCAMMAESM